MKAERNRVRLVLFILILPPPVIRPYSRTGNESTCEVAEKVFDCEACTDKNAQKVIFDTEPINESPFLNKLDGKSEGKQPDIDGIVVIFAAEYRLHKAVQCPHDDDITAVVANEVVVLSDSDHDLNSNESHKNCRINDTPLHQSSSLERSGKTPRLRFRIPFMQAIAVP